jgi:hypothetical protein
LKTGISRHPLCFRRNIPGSISLKVDLWTLPYSDPLAKFVVGNFEFVFFPMMCDDEATNEKGHVEPQKE